jgi:hypothetical protein
MSPATKKATKKKVDWIAASKGDPERASPRPKKEDEQHLPPGSTFLHEERYGVGASPMVVVSAKVPTSTRKENVPIPETLAMEIEEATFGVKVNVAIIALADYAVDRWESVAPATYEILPESEVILGEDGVDVVNWTCRFKKTKSPKLQVRLDKPLAYGTNSGNVDNRRTIPVPADVRARIEKLIPKDIRDSGYPRFAGTFVGMAKWALDDIRRRGIQLHVRQAAKKR